MKTKAFKDYETISLEIEALEAKRTKIKDQCLEEMLSEKIDTVKSDNGTFSVVERKSWTYTPKVAKQEIIIKETIKKVITPLETTLKELKKEEETSGKAKVEITNGIRYTPLKKNEEE